MDDEKTAGPGFARNLTSMMFVRCVSGVDIEAATGVHNTTVSRWKSGERKDPGARELVAVARFLGTTVEALLSDEPLVRFSVKALDEAVVKRTQEPPTTGPSDDDNFGVPDYRKVAAGIAEKQFGTLVQKLDVKLCEAFKRGRKAARREAKRLIETSRALAAQLDADDVVCTDDDTVLPFLDAVRALPPAESNNEVKESK